MIRLFYSFEQTDLIVLICDSDNQLIQTFLPVVFALCVSFFFFF
jgi:hypothetical protein